MTPIVQGLEITVLGLILTFSALGLFILTMLILQWVFPEKSDKKESIEPEPISADNIAFDEDSEVVAAIGIALSYWRTHQQSKLGQDLLVRHSNWWTANQMTRRNSLRLKK